MINNSNHGANTSEHCYTWNKTSEDACIWYTGIYISELLKDKMIISVKVLKCHSDMFYWLELPKNIYSNDLMYRWTNVDSHLIVIV